MEWNLANAGAIINDMRQSITDLEAKVADAGISSVTELAKTVATIASDVESLKERFATLEKALAAAIAPPVPAPPVATSTGTPTP